jgi:glycosyltransferase involved in cell wall biosynthesis
MGREGRRTAVNRYSWARVARELERYYLDLMRARVRS